MVWGEHARLSLALLQVCSSRQIYRLPNIYIQHRNGSWLDAPLQVNNQLYQILVAAQMQRVTTRVYRLAKAYSYFYANALTPNDREYLQRLVLTTYNQQSKCTDVP